MESIVQAVRKDIANCPKAVKDVFFRCFPEEVGTDYICDINGDDDPTCVWDEGVSQNPEEDCARAEKGIQKKDCSCWRVKDV